MVILLVVTYFTSVTLNSQEINIKNEIEKACLIKIGNSIGSGCFYQDSQYLYLITAKHVLYDNKGILKGKDGYLISYPYNAMNDQADTLIINFETLHNTRNLFGSSSSDIAVGKIAKINDLKDNKATLSYIHGIKKVDIKGSWIRSFQKNQYDFFSALDLGDDIYVLGFPSAIGIENTKQYDFKRPLLRKGIISGLSPKYKTFLIDCHVYGGNSGGPVIVKRDLFDFSQKGRIVRIQELKLIGIVAEFVPFKEVWENKNYQITNIEVDNSGYAVIIPLDPAFELIKVMNNY